MLGWFKRWWSPAQEPEHRLLVMRLTGMRRVHPDMDRDHVCANCGYAVGIYPSGQRVIRDHPRTIIICNHCEPYWQNYQLAPGAVNEPSQSRDA